MVLNIKRLLLFLEIRFVKLGIKGIADHAARGGTPAHQLGALGAAEAKLFLLERSAGYDILGKAGICENRSSEARKVNSAVLDQGGGNVRCRNAKRGKSRGDQLHIGN